MFGGGGLPINMSVMRYRKVSSEIQSNLLKISREGNGKEVATILISGKRVGTMTYEYINFLTTSNEIPSTNLNPNTTEYNIINLNIIIL